MDVYTCNLRRNGHNYCVDDEQETVHKDKLFELCFILWITIKQTNISRS